MLELGKYQVVRFLKGKKQKAHSWLPSEKIGVRRIGDSEYLLPVHPVAAVNTKLLGEIIRRAKPESSVDYFVPHDLPTFRRAIDEISASWEVVIPRTEADRAFYKKAKLAMEERHRSSAQEKLAISQEIKARQPRYRRARTAKRRKVYRMIKGRESLTDKLGRSNPMAMAMIFLYIDPHLVRQLNSDLVSADANRKRAEFYVELMLHINAKLLELYELCWSEVSDEEVLEALGKLAFKPFSYAVAVIKNEIKLRSFHHQSAIAYFEAERAIMNLSDQLSELRHDDGKSLDDVDFSTVQAALAPARSGSYVKLSRWLSSQQVAMTEAFEAKDFEEVVKLVVETEAGLRYRVDIDDPGTWHWLDADLLEVLAGKQGQLLNV